MLAEIVVTPVGDAGASFGSYVASAINAIQKFPVKIEVTAMGTNLEGSLDEVLKAFKAAHDACVKDGARRVLMSLRIDDRLDKSMTIEAAERSVEEHGATLH